MNTYQFILTPLDKIFFGKEKHPVRPSYYIESNPFAQQTGVLGLLRHYLLISTGKINEEKTKWTELIGNKSFDGDSQTEFGVINKIYPLFIWDKENSKHLLPYKDLSDLLYIKNNDVKVSYNNNQTKNLYRLVNNEDDDCSQENQLNPKENFFPDAFYSDNYSNPIPFSSELEYFTTPNFYGEKTKRLNTKKGVFVEHIQPGITKNYSAQKKEEAYFKTQYYKLNKDFTFSFYAEIDDNVKLNTDNIIFMTFGGEASPYRVEIKEMNNSNLPFQDNSGHGNIFHFLSDTIIEKSTFQDSIVQFIGETQYFRYLKADLKNIYNLERKPESIDQFFSKSRIMIKKGSIAFINPEKITDFLGALNDKNYEAYHNIGYNYYKQLQKLN